MSSTVSFVKYNLEELESAKNELSNLLAVIHADGGHYEAEHGTAKAVKDAKEKVLLDRSDLSLVGISFKSYFVSLNDPMPCGHAARYVYPPDGDAGTTRYCAVCELEAWREDHAEKQWLKQGKA